MATDIDNFIRDQKAKLASERKVLADHNFSIPAPDSTHKQWDRSGERGAYLAIQREPPERQQVHRGRPVTPVDAVGLPVGDYQRNRKQLDEQRQREYRDYVQQRQARQPGGDGGGRGQQHDYKQASVQLAQERRQEYNELLAAKEREPKQAPHGDEITNPSIIPYNRAQEEQKKKRLLEAQRHRDYQEMKARLDETQRFGRHDDQDVEHVGLPLGQYESSKQKLREQEQFRQDLQQQVQQKKRLQLHQYGAPTPDTTAYHPQLDKRFSELPKDATYVKGSQSDRQDRAVPRLGLSSLPSGQTSQNGIAPVDSRTVRARLQNGDENYREIWLRMHPQQGPDGGDSRRGTGYVGTLAERERARRDEESYRALWEQAHKKKMPRKPADQKALGRVSDRTNTEAAVVQREKRTEKSKHGEGLQEKARIKPPERAPSPAPAVHDTGSDPYKESAQRGTVHAPAPDRLEARKKSELEYQRLWKEVHGNKKEQDVGKSVQNPGSKVPNPQASTNVYEQQKKALQAELKQEMQTFMQQQKEEHRDQEQRRQWDPERERGKAILDSEDQAEAAKRRLAEDRRREYEAVKSKSEGKGERRKWEAPETALAEQPLKLGEYERRHQEIQKERQQDYNKMLQSQKQGNRSWREPSAEKLLPVGESEGRRKELEAQRNREYNEYLKSKRSGNRTWREPSAEKLLPLGDYEQKRRAIEEQQKAEYQDFLKKSAAEEALNRRMWKESTQEEFLPRGEQEQTREKLRSERQQEYRQYLQETQESQRHLRRFWREPSVEEMLPLGKYEDKRKLLGLERKQEYNDYLKHLSPRSRHHTWKELSKEDLVPMGKYEDTWEKLRQDREERLRSRGEETEKLRRAFGDTPIPGLWGGDQLTGASNVPEQKAVGVFSHNQPQFSDRDRSRAKDQREMHGGRRDPDWSQPGQPTEQLKKVRISLDQPLFPEAKFENARSPPLETRLMPSRPVTDPLTTGIHTPPRPFEAYQQQLQEERRREYNNMLERKRQEEAVSKASKRHLLTPSTVTEDSLFSRLGSRESERSKLREERRREYNEMMTRKKLSEMQRERESPLPNNAGQILSRMESRESDQERLRRERQREYNDFLHRSKEAEALKSRNRKPGKYTGSDDGLFSRLGSRESEREKLREQRHQEYKEYLKQNTDRRSLNQQTDEYKANSLPGMNESDNAKVYKACFDSWPNNFFWEPLFTKRDKNFVDIKPYSIQKERQRNEEYNQFLQSKSDGERNRVQNEKDPEAFATLPGLRDSGSAKKRKEVQRNAEYNLFLQSKRMPAKNDGRPPVGPRTGWATPVATYEDLLERKRYQEAQYRRANDPAYDKPLESDRRLAELDKELEAKKTRFRTEQLSQGVLDDPAWLSPRKGPSDIQYEDLQPRRDRRGEPSNYYASLPLGGASTEYEKQREKEQYREDLQRQIREAADGRRKDLQAHRGTTEGEKSLDLKVNYSGLTDPEVSNVPKLALQSRRERQSTVRPYHSKLLDGLEKLDQISPRSEAILGRRRFEDLDLGAARSLSRASTRLGGAGLLDAGYENLLENPRVSTIAPPPGLEYQPASYITQGAGALGQSSVDEAYSFYATRNPLEEAPVGGGGGGGDARSSRANQEVSFGGGGGGGGRSRVRFQDDVPRQSTGILDIPTDDDKKRQNQGKAQAYQEELARQIEENKRKKLKEREEKERYDRKLEQEAKDYNPYGRGGGGAPMRDGQGNLVADLRSMRRDNNDPDSPRKTAYVSPRAPEPSSVRDDLFGPPPVQTTAFGEQSHARGGHGIFGMPKTDAEKVASERYKDDLRRQIEERKIEELRKKEKERQEEEREQRRVEDQQRRMQEEYEEERRKIREKEEEARRKNEELVRLAEERKKETEDRRREAEEQRLEQERREKEAEINARLREARGDSPPVPAARTRDNGPLPSTSRDEPLARPQSTDVLNQLAAMRKQLQTERQRVETMLQTEKNAPDVFDPRLVQRPPPAPVVRPEIDVFETARSRNAVAHRRTPADRPNAQAMDDFDALKHKDNTESRKEFLKLFPDQPSSGDTLEAQQAALLRQQERSLQTLREQRQYDSGYPRAAVPRSPRTQSLTPQQLHSDSAFVGLDNLNHLPDDFDDIPSSRNESARLRRRSQREPSPRVGSQYSDPFGSVTSLNVDRLSKKNEDRLRRLRELQGDDVSVYDPDDVLDRFMSKQGQNRPPSGQTLQDDTWMFAGSKASGY